MTSTPGGYVQLHPRTILRDDFDPVEGEFRVANLPLGIRTISLSRSEFALLASLRRARPWSEVEREHQEMQHRADARTDLIELVERGTLLRRPGPHADPVAMPWLDVPRGGLGTRFDPARTPHTLYIELTQACNLQCGHCFATEGGSQATLPMQSVVSILKEADQLGVLHVTLSGGEPLLHPEFSRILEQVARSRMAINLLTNATRFEHHPEWIEQIVQLSQHENQAMSVGISVDGFRAETHDRVRGRAGSLSKTKQAIERLVEQGFRAIGLEVSLFEHNYQQFPLIVEWAADLGLDSVTPFNVLSLGRARQSSAYSLSREIQWDILQMCMDLQERFAGRLEIPTPKTAIRYFVQSLRGKVSVPDRTVCSAGMQELAIRATGDIHPCPYVWDPAFTLGTIPETTLLDAWRDPRLAFFRGGYSVEDIEGCSTCDHSASCLARICRAPAIASGNPFACSPECFNTIMNPPRATHAHLS